VRVELDIFSGRPNPTWELGERESVELESIIERASPSPRKVDPPGLGYRGFIIYLLDPVRIYKGEILNEHAGSQNRLSDFGIKLDLWLLETGKAHIDPAIYDACLVALQHA